MKILFLVFRALVIRALRHAAGLEPALRPAYIRKAGQPRNPSVYEGESRRLDEPNRW